MKYAMRNHITPFEKNPSAFGRYDYSVNDKKKIIAYMKSPEPDTALGLVWDCVEAKETREENVGYEDNTFMWSSQDIYHIEKYNAAVTEDFLKHILND